MTLVQRLPSVEEAVQAFIRSIKDGPSFEPFGSEEVDALVQRVASAAHEGLQSFWPTASVQRIQRRSGTGSDLDWDGIERIVVRPNGIFVQFTNNTPWEACIYDDPFRFYFNILKSPTGGLMTGASSDDRLKFHISVMEPLERRVISHLALRAFDRKGQCVQSWGFTFSLTALLRALEKILPQIGELILFTGRQDEILQIDVQSKLDPDGQRRSVALVPFGSVVDPIRAFEKKFGSALTSRVRVE